MRTFLKDDLYCEVLTKEKLLTDRNIIDNILDSPNIILSSPSQIDEDFLEKIALNCKCNLLVIEDKQQYFSTISSLYDNSVVLYNQKNIVKLREKLLDEKIRDLLSSLGFLMNSKDVEVLIEVLKYAYDSPQSFYKLEDIYKIVAEKHNVKSGKIRRDVIEAVNVMNNHITKNNLRSFFHIIGNDTVPVKQCISYIIDYLKNNKEKEF